MIETNQISNQAARIEKQWTVSYTQSDVNTIREQIMQTERAKRRWLILALVFTVAGLVGLVALLTSSYALYASSQSDRKRMASENATLRSRAEQLQQELDGKVALEADQSRARAEAQAALEKLLPRILNSTASANEIADFARMVYALPNGRIELAAKPPDKLFLNWKVDSGSATEIYTLVGGFVDGRWVVYSNLIARSEN